MYRRPDHITRFHNGRGFTLIELVAVIVIVAILGTIALYKLSPVGENLKVAETRQEMEALATAIVGNPDLHNNGVRSDFGYVGDVGALPPDLDALRANPGLMTWNGPYVENRFSQRPDDFKNDAWQSEYVYTGGVTITSIGSGSPIIRRLAGTTGHLLHNSVSGSLFDLDGTPPGSMYRDSVGVVLTIPDGAGNMAIKTAAVDIGGYFSFDSVPIGNHRLDIIYYPDFDTLHRFVSVHPNSSLYAEYFFAANVWHAGGGAAGLEFVTGSDTLRTGNCNRLSFWMSNHTGTAVSISSLTLTWTAPAAYYRSVFWNGSVVRSGDPALGSGDTAIFTTSRAIGDGESVSLEMESFRSNPGGGGQPVDMTGTAITVSLSDGSTFTFTANRCGG